MRKFLKLVLVSLLPVAAAAASEDPEVALDTLVDLLAAEQFFVGLEAEQVLIARAQQAPGEVRSAIEHRLANERDPEIRIRLATVLDKFSRPAAGRKAPALEHKAPAPQKALTTTVSFNRDALANGVWEFHGKPPLEARYTLVDGILEIDSLGQLTDAMGFVHRFPQQPAEGESIPSGPPRLPGKSERLVLDAEIKILEEQHDRPGLAGVHLNIEDDRSSAGLMILEDRIFLYRRKAVHLIDTTDQWHHYRFVIEKNRQEIFVDDMTKPVLSTIRPPQRGRAWATFGDGTAGAGARAQIRKVALSRTPLAEK